jgi:hypothetical protein
MCTVNYLGLFRAGRLLCDGLGAVARYKVVCSTAASCANRMVFIEKPRTQIVSTACVISEAFAEVYVAYSSYIFIKLSTFLATP